MILLKKTLKVFFNKGHLQRIYSNYLGPRSVITSSLTNHPFQKALFAACYQRRCKKQDNRDIRYEDMPSLDNIWKAKYRYTKTLNRVFIVPALCY
ncbi:hypothetical protein AB4K20DRAFT_1626394 [Rhizopus microsporus]